MSKTNIKRTWRRVECHAGLVLGLILFLTGCSATDALPQQQHKIWPAATTAEVYSSQTTLVRTMNLHAAWTVMFSGYAQTACQPKLQAALDRFYQRLDRMVPIQPDEDDLLVHHSLMNPSNATLQILRGLHIHISTPDEALYFGMDESYELRIPDSNNNNSPADAENNDVAYLTAPTVHGILHGLVSFWQLIQFGWFDDCTHNCRDPSSRVAIFTIAHAPIWIQDAPVYAYRGILVDTIRHYLPWPLLYQHLDIMEWNKLSVLHWHLTDSQSWAYASRNFPELATAAAYCPSCTYRPEDIAVFVAEAGLRGIQVVVEIDLPGHSQAIGASHPELMTDCGPIRGPSEPLNATSQAVYDFVRTLYHEVAPLFGSDSSWMHVGGDEVSLECWQNSSQIQQWMKDHGMKEEVELLAYFETNLLQIVTQELGRRPIVWQELFDSELTLPPQTVVDVWMIWNLPTIEKATAQGYDVVVSACWYLDQLEVDWRGLYKCEPRTMVQNLTAAQLRHIVGGHASMWGEQVDEFNFMPRVWPRASAVAEKLWTGSTEAALETSANRINEFRCRMVQQGVPASPVVPGYCPHDDIDNGDDSKDDVFMKQTKKEAPASTT